MLLGRLIGHAGELVTREELKEAVWPSGTYVEFDFGLNTAINRLRRALRDSAADPKYIETVPKQGYRFIAPVELVFPPPGPSPELVEDFPGAQLPPEPELPAPTPVIHGFGRTKQIVLASAVLLAICGVTLVSLRVGVERSEAAEPVHSLLSLPPGQTPEVVVISPTGDQIVYQALENGSRRLYRRYLNDEASRPVPGSEDDTQPFFSPDGKDVGFFSDAAIRIVSETGTRDLVPVPRDFALRKAIWAADQFVYYTTPSGGIWKVPATGGTPEPALKPESKDGSTLFYFPQQVLAGHPAALLFSTNNGPIRRSIGWATLGGESTPHLLLNRAMGGQVESGYLLSWWEGKLRAAPFDSRNRRLTGSPVDALTNVGNNGWRGPIASLSGNGTLVYIPDYEMRKRLLWVDRAGRETPLPVPPALYEQAEASPDGTRVCIARRDGPGHWSLWILDLRTGAWTSLLDMEAPRPRAIWSPDGKAIVASAITGDDQFVNLYRIALDRPGAPERLTNEPNYGQFPSSWSAARNAILFVEGVHPGTQSDIHVLPLEGERLPRPLVTTAGVERCPAFSPDGQWFAFSSDQGSDDQVFIQAFDRSSPPRRVSPAGGVCPAWSNDGKRLYYLDPARALFEVPYEGNGRVGSPRQLFPPGFTETTDWWTRGYSVLQDGRFLVIRLAPGEKQQPPQIHLISNWTTELKRLAPKP